MKHIVRKPFKEWRLNLDAKNALASSGTIVTGKALDAIEADKYVGYIETIDDKLIQTFPFIKDGVVYQVVEPHPVTLYFNGAQFFIKHVSERRALLLLEIEKPIYGLDVRKQLDALYTFFSNFAMFTTFLYNSLETFVNYVIPDDYRFEVVGKRNTEIYNKSQIQRNLPTDRKLWEVLPDVFGKKFDNEREKYLKNTVLKLKECRDEITHTKYGGDSYPNGYKKLFTRALEFDCEGTLNAIAEVINFYEPNLIEECGCGVDH